MENYLSTENSQAKTQVETFSVKRSGERHKGGLFKE